MTTGRRLGSRFSVSLAALAAVLAAGTVATDAAVAADPSAGGYTVASPLERRLAAVATRLAGRRATVHCNGPRQWRRWSAIYGWKHNTVVYAFVPETEHGLADQMHVSPSVCSLTARFVAAPRRRGQKRCLAGVAPKHGATQRGRARNSRRFARCARYAEVVDSIETIGHEAAHIAGVEDEGAAECAGLQTTALVAVGLGAPAAFAREVGRDYMPLYAGFTARSPEYAAEGCFDGGPYDLWPELRGWPTPPAVAAAWARGRSDQYPPGWTRLRPVGHDPA